MQYAPCLFLSIHFQPISITFLHKLRHEMMAYTVILHYRLTSTLFTIIFCHIHVCDSNCVISMAHLSYNVLLTEILTKLTNITISTIIIQTD